MPQAGIHAYETDLAELIVQLGKDRPSHILVPAIHRNRAEIRDIFLREMAGVDPGLTDTPAALTEAARLYLRRAFLSARVGISGANFAVAETGTLCVLESEGNGRMCLTLPDTLITVMGIEKVVPAWRDLDVFMQLLPRSSTGERMNPYTSMWTGVTPGDGPQAFHLVLLDNGRTAALADETGRQALHCIRCSACLNVCPVYERTGGHAYGSVYPGPIGAVLSPQLTGVEDNASLPYASTLCGACYDACPVKIDIPSLLVHLRARHVEEIRAGAPGGQPGGGHHGRRLLGDGQPGPLGGRAERQPARPRARPRRPHPPAAAAAVGLDRRAGRTNAAAPDLPRVVAEGTRGPAVTGPAARDEVLARIRTALGGPPPGSAAPGSAPPGGQAPPADPVPRGYRTSGDLGTAQLLDLLAERLRDYGCTVRRTAPDQLLATVAEALGQRGAARVVVPSGLDLAGLPAGTEIVAGDGLSPAALDAVDGVITGAAVAIAETGTIVLDGSPGQGRRALSLVPDYHLCIVRADQVVALVPEALARLDPRRPLTWISGPSATSDIELDRVQGVHGPRTLEVILVGPAPQ